MISLHKKDRLKQIDKDTRYPANDYNSWMHNYPNRSIQNLIDLLSTPSIKQRKTKGTENIPTGNSNWKIIRVLDYDAAVYYGENTTWCISGRYSSADGKSGEQWFNDDKDNNTIDYYFIINRVNDEKWCYLADTTKANILEKENILFDNYNREYKLKDLPKVISYIPIDVLDKLPNLSYYLKPYKDALKYVTADGTLNYENGVNTYLLRYVTKKIVIKDGVTKIPSLAFAQFEKLKSVEISKSVKEIDGSAFYGIDSLKEVTFEKGSKLKIIGEHAFAYTGITEITIPEYVEEIYDFAFPYSIKKIFIEGKYRPYIFSEYAVNGKADLVWVDEIKE